MQYTAENLLIRPSETPRDPDLILDITPETAGWKFIAFQVRHLEAGDSWTCAVEEAELAFVNLTGRYTIETSRGEWKKVGGRDSVFESAAHVLYLPRHTKMTVTAEKTGDFAVARVPAGEDHPPFLIKPEDVPVSVRGGDNATRQINDLLPPGSPVQRLVLVEVYTPGGNWSSYPGHKHDLHLEAENGDLIEADLEEVYFYRFDVPGGYAFQRVYTGADSPLQTAGAPIDATVMPKQNHAVLVPEGYHPVASPPGVTTYYLNVLAGSAQSLANRDDPVFTKVKDRYTAQDPRVPLY
jgi:5-deoxy-glucuronate isomerase